MELLEGIWNILLFFLFFGGATFGIAYLSGISSDVKRYKIAYQEQLKRIKELEGYLEYHRKAQQDSLKKIKEVEGYLECPREFNWKPIDDFISIFSSNDIDSDYIIIPSVKDRVVTFWNIAFIKGERLKYFLFCAGTPEIQKDAFTVFLNGSVAEIDTIDSITSDEHNVIITFNSNLNFSLDSVDEFMIQGPFEHSPVKF